MTKYHVDPATGNVGLCSAEIKCRFGGDEVHGDSVEKAVKAYEKIAAQEGLDSFTSVSKKELPASAATFSEKKLAELGVNEELAEKILDAGFTINSKSFYEELKTMPVYVGQEPEPNDRVRVIRRTYREDGTIKSTETHTGKFVPVEEHDGRESRTGSMAIVTDSKPFSDDDINYLNAESLQRMNMEKSDGSWMRVRNKGPVNFDGSSGGYIEHDTIERLGPPNPAAEEQNKLISAANKATIDAKYKEEARARRPWPFNRISSN